MNGHSIFGILFVFAMGWFAMFLVMTLGQVSMVYTGCNGLMNSSLTLAGDCQELANQCSAQNTQCQDILRERNEFAINWSIEIQRYNECVRLYNSLRKECFS
jgi:hypothetical protein